MPTWPALLEAIRLAAWFWLVGALVFGAHFAGGTNWVLSNYALQGEVPDRLRGRVFATGLMPATLAMRQLSREQTNAS